MVLTETMTSTGHLPKFADDAYHVERDDLWLIPTAEVPLTSMHRGEILEESQLPLRFTASTACYRRRRARPGGTPAGCCGCTSSTRWSCSPTRRPTTRSRPGRHPGAGRVDAPGARAALPGAGPVLRGPRGVVGPDLRPGGLRAGVDRWLEVSSVSWFRDYQARRANVRYRPAGGGPLQLVHTVNGSALAWPRIWAALVENGRQEDGTVLLPECLAPYLGGELLIKAP